MRVAPITKLGRQPEVASDKRGSDLPRVLCVRRSRTSRAGFSVSGREDLWRSVRMQLEAPLSLSPQSGSQIQYGSQASVLLTTPHFRHTKFKPFQRLKTSVLNRPSQQVRRELALGERFSGFSRPGRSTGPPQKPQESCQTAGGSGMGRERITLKLADGVGFEPTIRF